MTKLEIYTGTLLELGERRLTSLSEDREPRRVLDDAYDGILAECLQESGWNFAIRTVQIAADTGLSSSFGYTKVFGKPADWVRTEFLSVSENFNSPLIEYSDEGAYWLANVDPLYIRYVSNDPSYGLDLSKWGALYTKYVILSLASQVCIRITQDKSMKDRLDKEQLKAKRKALNKNGAAHPPRFMPQGTFVLSRQGRTNRRGIRSSSDVIT